MSDQPDKPTRQITNRHVNQAILELDRRVRVLREAVERVLADSAVGQDTAICTYLRAVLKDTE